MATAKLRQASEHNINIIMTPDECMEVSQALYSCLANTQLLFQKTQFYHWNVTGPNFYSLHKLFEKQYNTLKDKGDIIAERVRALGNNVPGTYAEFQKLATISEDESLPENWQQMVSNLVECHVLGSEEARRALEVAQDIEDDVSVDIMIDIMKFHEKSAWMLRSTLQ